MRIRVLLAAGLLGVSGFLGASAHAVTNTVTLDVPGMTCSACPITVKKALMKVPGVVDAKVSYEPKEAVVKYDDAKTNPDALMKAPRDAGYPSTVKGK